MAGLVTDESPKIGNERREQVLELSIDRSVIPWDPDVLAFIKTKAREILNDKKLRGVFEADLDSTGNFEYGVDYFMGDIVQCYINNLNVQARVVELARIYSPEGYTTRIGLDFII